MLHKRKGIPSKSSREMKLDNEIENIFIEINLTLFRMGGWGKKDPPTSFSPVTSTNVGISLQNFLTFSFNPFATLV